MKHKIRKIKHCLLCKNKKIKKIFSLGNLFVSNFVNKKQINNGIKSPLTLIYCPKCTLLQLSHIAPQEIMYKRFYWYRSGVTKTMRKALKDIYKSSLKHIKLCKNDVVLDIGANDGTLLKYYNKNIQTIGCEPAKNLVSELKKNCNYVLNDFWSYNKLNNILKKKKLKKPKIIMAIGMFYDLENPNKFIRDSALALDKKGIFIAQLMCLKSMIDKNDIGNICHEHIEFYSLKSLKYLFESNDSSIPIESGANNSRPGHAYLHYEFMTDPQPKWQPTPSKDSPYGTPHDGNKRMKANKIATIQLYKFNIHSLKEQGDELLLEKVPYFRLYIPKILGKGFRETKN